MLLGRVQFPRRRIGEPAVAETACRALPQRRVAAERGPERRLAEGLAELGDDLGGRVIETIEDAQQSRADVLPRRGALVGHVPGETEQMVALGARQMESLRDGREHLWRRLRSAFPFEPGVVVRRHVRERRGLFATQSRGTTTDATRHPDVLGLQRLAPRAEEVRESRPVDHVPCLPAGRPPNQDAAIPPSAVRPGVAAVDREGRSAQPGIDGSWLSRGARRTVGSTPTEETP